jgi:uncharacterized protein
MVNRIIAGRLNDLAAQFKAIAIVGPRQSGKTTLTRLVFKDKPYASLENPDTRQFALEDPRGFLAQFPDGAVLDEAQRTPALFSYLQQILDEDDRTGKFILTGSNNFLLQESISQSLAGRIAYVYLLPFSIAEIEQISSKETLNEILFKGAYPPVYDKKIDPLLWYPNYIRTYVERDVRQIKNINNLILFERLLKLCAARIGQLLNLSSLAIETGVDTKTIQSWLGVLESSFIIHLLRPHYQNFSKRIVKMPKLYFHDTGLICSLLGIQHAAQLDTHLLKGSIFENWVLNELIKNRFNKALPVNLHFWRDNTGNEIDVIIDQTSGLYPVEIKAGRTITPEFFKNLKFWEKLTGTSDGTVVYAGETAQSRSGNINFLPWNQIGFL